MHHNVTISFRVFLEVGKPIKAMMRVNLYSAHVIQKKNICPILTEDQNDLKSIYSSKKKMLKMLDLFAFAYHQVQPQERYFDELEDECLGFKEVLQENMVSPLGSFSELM
ncbi:hypothetical protein K501DRAFT_272848 [Backusella circina FSU 941]|nr:hypothetical protein K501DRAFT_272848 [Backusella circina FSU 941]